MTTADFRSDTVTLPTDTMRQAMATAEVGDDVFGEDPTANRLERLAADLFGKEAGLLLPSGTMANQIALRIHTHPGEEVVCEARSHVYNYEVGAMAALWGLQARPVSSDRGIPTIEEIGAAIRADGPAPTPRTGLIVLENTHNAHGGSVVPLPRLREVHDLARDRGLRVHIDGARIFNAAVAHETPERRYGEVCDTLSFCLCKGLGAPIGSLLVGSSEAIDRARRVRKMLGGGMRQVGIIAAAGIVALEEMIERLAEDHALAETMARRFQRIRGVRDLRPAETNIVVFDLEGEPGVAPQVEAALAERQILTFAMGPHSMRWVTHKEVGPEEADRAIRAFQEVYRV